MKGCLEYERKNILSNMTIDGCFDPMDIIADDELPGKATEILHQVDG
jgi:hypothetical protein